MTHTVTIVGGGQLARLLALRGLHMGWQFSFLLEAGEDPSSVETLGSVVRHDRNEEPLQLFHRLGSPRWITVEREHLPFETLRALSAYCPVRPEPDTVALFADRASERHCLAQSEIPVAGHHTLSEPRELPSLFEDAPLVIKASHKGYDGRGQWRVRNRVEAEEFAATATRQPYLVEDWVPFQRELSIVGARAVDGSTVFYPPSENLHRNGILLTTLSPAPALAPEREALLREYLQRLMDSLDYVGVMAMECFETDDSVLINEIAPRVHNTGHWTSLGCDTDQFENHLRAVAGLPLAAPRPRGACGMVNLLGGYSMSADELQRHGQLYLYNKHFREGRKLGHLCLADEDPGALARRLADLEQKLYSNGEGNPRQSAGRT